MDVQAATHVEVQAEHRNAIDALRRLAATRDDLAALYQAQPFLGDVNVTGVSQLLEALPRFWAATATGKTESRIAELAGHLASVMNEEAALRGQDGTLGDGAVSLARRAITAAGSDLPMGVHGYELMLGDAAHAGSLILVGDDVPGVALLFTAHGGWEAYDSLDRLLETTRRRLLESVAAADGTGVGNDAFAEARKRNSVGYRHISGAVFTTLARRMVDVQAERIAIALDDYRLDSDELDAEVRLGDSVRRELSLSAMLDVDGIESLRESRLLEVAMARRLSNVPVAVREAWYKARDNYNDVLSTASMLRAIAGATKPLTLHAFATQELATRLATLGIDESPDGITVEVSRVKVLPSPLEWLDPFPGSTKARRMSLVEFTCENIGRFSLDTLHATDSKGASLRDSLGHDALRQLVRDLDIANRYPRHVEEHLREGTVGALTRKLALAVQATQMRLEAEESRLSYYLPGEPRSFIDDRDERGFRWVEAALDATGGRGRVGKHEIAVSQLTYRQVALDGILLFASLAGASAPRVVMYTPGAPDGLSFREFDSRQDAARRFLYHPAFREYLLDRLPVEFARVLPNGTRREFAGDRLAHWVLGANSDVPYTLTAEPFGERRVTGDFFAAAYDAMVEKYGRDTRFLARSTADADSDALLALLQNRLNARPAAVAASMVIDVPASFARMMQASWRYYDHVKAGDTGQAFVAFAEGYANALNLVTPPFIGGRAISAAFVGSRYAARGIARTDIRLGPTRVRFDDRYAARSLRRPGKPDHEGIFRVNGLSYIEQDGGFYRVRYHRDYDRWRLAPLQGGLDAHFTGPVVERVEGRWVYAHDVGLRGGMRRLRQRFSRASVNDQAPPVPAAGHGPAPVAAAAEDALANVYMPRVMLPHRAEILAALTDNPSANPLIQNDGSNLQFMVRTRSALIVDSHLHPDILGLSAHQRRAFLHELDARFPLVAERTEVLDSRGWVRQEGRRVPGSPSSPSSGQAPGDVQSPTISSTTGDPATAPRVLTPSQVQRWEDALAVARSKPRSPQATTSANSGQIDSLPALESVPIDEWPPHVWYFSERPFTTEFNAATHDWGVTLGRQAGWGAAPGTRTYPVSVVPPEAPIGRLSEVLGTSPVQQGAQRDPLGYWVLIDLARYRESRRLTPHHAMPSPASGVGMHRRLLPGGEYQYTLTRTSDIRIPEEFVISVGRRGGPAGPLGPPH